LCGGGFLIIYFIAVACPFKAVSVVVQSISKTVGSKHQSFKFAGRQTGYA
jgi:hypothetical protein